MNELDNLNDQLFQPLTDEEQAGLTGGEVSITACITFHATLTYLPDPDGDMDVDASN